MSQQDEFSNIDPVARPLDLARWRNLPLKLLGAGLLIGLIGLGVALTRQAATSFLLAYVVAFMFLLSLGAGALFLVLVHHLFDAGWSVPIRRCCEHLSVSVFSLTPGFFLPIGVFAKQIYPWLSWNPHLNHALHAKQPIFTTTGFWLVSIGTLAILWFLSWRLRSLSVSQDQDGAAHWTHKMRVTASIGIFLYGFSLTFGAIMWMKALELEWFSTMYGVYYFAGCVWLVLATVYVITMILDRQGIISDVLHEHQYYYLGSLLFAFTVFYAYVTFSQYFIIWNANMPEETFYFVVREKGSWFWVGMVIIFGHFFLPFLALLRIDVKSNFAIMIPLAIWSWLMHFVDMIWCVFPPHFRAGFPVGWSFVAFGLTAAMVGVLMLKFLKEFKRTAPFPQKDPRLIEAMGLYHPTVAKSAAPGGGLGATAPTGGNH